jgi:hypothetical protein
VEAELPHVAAFGLDVDVELFEVPVEELVEGCPGLGVALLVDLGEEPRAGPLGFLGGGWSGRDGLGEVVPLAGDRVLSDVPPEAVV